MQFDYFSIPQLLPAVFWLIIILVIAQSRKGKYSLEEGKYYMINVYTKLFFSLAFVLFFLIVYGGGDTIAYMDGTVCLNNLFLDNPGLYFEQMLSTPTDNSISLYFNARTGYPPGWIYREPEGFFVCKITSILSLITFKSYIAITFLMSFFVASASYRVYVLIRKMKIVRDGYLAIGFLFLPSVNFWCTGVSKDSIVHIGVLTMFYHGFLLLTKDHKRRLRSILIFTAMALSGFPHPINRVICNSCSPDTRIQ